GVFDENGALLFDFTESDGRATRSIAKMPDGRVSVLQMVMTMENAGASPVIKIIDADNKKYADEVLYLDFGTSNWGEIFFVTGYEGYDLLRCEITVIYGVCHDTGDLEVLAKYDKNYTFPDIHKYAVISSGNILKLDHSSTRAISVMKYTKTDAPIHTDKTKLVLGVFFSTEMINRTVSDFNKINPDYEIEIKEYMGERGVDFIGALDAYNLDLITGNIPDITSIHIVASMPLQSYFDKGVFVDLYELFDADPDIGREDFVDSVLKALETDGKLYTMAPSFEITTLIGKKSVVGADMGWTWDEFFALLDKNPEAIPISISRESFTSEWFVSNIIENTSDTFINTSAGTCDFQSDIFTKLLEYGKRYPREIGNNDFITANDFLSGDRLLLLENFKRLDYFHATKLQTYFGEEITYKGFPTLDGSNGSSFYLYHRFGISSNSEHREGAWEYIKYLLTDYQYMESFNNTWAIRDFPVRKDVLNSVIESDFALGVGVNSDDNFPVNIEGAGMVNTIFPSEADVEKLYALINSIDKISRTDHLAVSWIINEELPSYFDGQRTAEQVAAIIQNRAGIYMAEIS
ncbi:MAG: extracellular solute-binding protein, partial [Oscillospiraceae bacterium]|nr:extracellular solute-binding protein [Oscillospiraceae bacterium]